MPIEVILVVSLLTIVCSFSLLVAEGLNPGKEKLLIECIITLSVSIILLVSSVIFISYPIDKQNNDPLLVKNVEVDYIESKNYHIMSVNGVNNGLVTFERYFEQSYNGQKILYMVYRKEFLFLYCDMTPEYVIVENE